jgi:hypothetical protein
VGVAEEDLRELGTSEKKQKNAQEWGAAEKFTHSD